MLSSSQRKTNETKNNNNNNIIDIRNTNQFQIVFGILLGLIFIVRAVMCGLLVRYRKDSNLQLAQPLVLATLIASGSVAIISCVFFVHNDWTESNLRDDMFCMMRDPMILLPLTLAGNILLGRVWRIVLLLTPVFTAGRSVSHHESDEGLSWGQRSKGFLIYELTRLGDFYCWLEWVIINTCKGSQTTAARKLKRTSTALRKKIPLQQLFLLSFLLTLPQTILQILNLTVPAMKERLELQDTLVFGDFSAELHTCTTDVGSWPTYIGIALTLVPYIMTAVIAWNSADELPKVFNEAKAYTKCVKVMILTVAIALPPLFFDPGLNPDTNAYLISMLVFGLAMPPCWFIAYPKIWLALTTVDEGQTTQTVLKRLLKKNKQASTVLSSKNREDNGKSAKLALTIGKMYEEMGMEQKSIDLFDEALAVWECDPGREHKQQIGGFTLEEINSFSVQDLEHIVSLLIAKGRVTGTFQVGQNTGQKDAAQSWLDALEIYEKAPARANMKDRSMLFPVFSGLFVFLKGGKIQQDAKCNFEQNLARKFVRETKLQGDPVHYTRALAMFCEVKARLGKFKVALETFETLKGIYDPEEHSEGVSAAYGTDRSAQAFSQSALWYLQLGQEEKALEACEYVLYDLMPIMDPKNVLNSCEMLLPIIYVYKTRGQEDRMNKFFHKYVINNHNQFFKEKSSPCEPVFKPLTMLLSICHDPENFPKLEDAVEWLVVEENGVASEFLDSIYTKLCWSMFSLCAELCLRVAKRLLEKNGDLSDAHILILKGLKLSKQAEKKMVNSKGTVILPIAYALHEPVYKELRDISGTMGISSEDEFTSLHSSFHQSSVSSSMADPKNLPSSYLKNRNSSEGSTGSGSHLSSGGDMISPSMTTVAHYDSGTTSNSSASMDRASISRNSTSRLESFVEETADSMDDGSISLNDTNEDNTNGESKNLDQQKRNGDNREKVKSASVPNAHRESENLHVTFSSSSRIDEGSDPPPTEQSTEVATKV